MKQTILTWGLGESNRLFHLKVLMDQTVGSGFPRISTNLAQSPDDSTHLIGLLRTVFAESLGQSNHLGLGSWRIRPSLIWGLGERNHLGPGSRGSSKHLVGVLMRILAIQTTPSTEVFWPFTPSPPRLLLNQTMLGYS